MREDQVDRAVDFLVKFYDRDLFIATITLDTIERITYLLGKDACKYDKIVNHIKNLNHKDELCKTFLKYEIAQNLELDSGTMEFYETKLYETSRNLSDLFLMNLKTAVPWIVKSTNIKYIDKFIKYISPVSRLHTATHLCNLVKVSAVEFVRNQAGRALLKLAPLLSVDQRNDVYIELVRGLEIEGYEFSKYIPRYLGEFMLYLHPKEFDESIDDLEKHVKRKSSRTIPLILNTMGVIIEHYHNYPKRFEEDNSVFEDRLIRILGLFLSGLSNYDENIKQESFLFIGKNILIHSIFPSK